LEEAVVVAAAAQVAVPVTGGNMGPGHATLALRLAAAAAAQSAVV